MTEKIVPHNFFSDLIWKFNYWREKRQLRKELIQERKALLELLVRTKPHVQRDEIHEKLDDIEDTLEHLG